MPRAGVINRLFRKVEVYLVEQDQESPFAWHHKYKSEFCSIGDRARACCKNKQLSVHPTRGNIAFLCHATFALVPEEDKGHLENGLSKRRASDQSVQTVQAVYDICIQGRELRNGRGTQSLRGAALGRSHNLHSVRQPTWYGAGCFFNTLCNAQLHNAQPL